MSDPKKDLVVTLTIPTDEDSDVTVNVSGANGETITQGEVVYYLFQTATSILSHMSESEHGATIQMIEEFFE